jgi:hypothetical protein
MSCSFSCRSNRCRPIFHGPDSPSPADGTFLATPVQFAADAPGILAIAGILALAPSAASGKLADGGFGRERRRLDRPLGSGPAPVVWETLTGAVDWARGLSDHFGVAGLLGLVLLSVPLFTWLRRLMPESPGLEGGPAWSGAMLEEGAVA